MENKQTDQPGIELAVHRPTMRIRIDRYDADGFYTLKLYLGEKLTITFFGSSQSDIIEFKNLLLSAYREAFGG